MQRRPRRESSLPPLSAIFPGSYPQAPELPPAQHGGGIVASVGRSSPLTMIVGGAILFGVVALIASKVGKK
jgi:hypothetical protein